MSSTSTPDLQPAPPTENGSSSSTPGFGTRAVHAGQRPDPSTGAIMPPVYFTSTYVQDAPGDHKGYEYARVSNPTRTALEGNLAALEGARHCIAFSSGMASIDALLKTFRPGDHILSTNDLYGGTFRLMTQVFEPFGLNFTFADLSSMDAVAEAITPNTRLLWIETPTNPLLRVFDIVALSELAHRNNITVGVDNTFASPYLQQPLALGADLVMHSTTKYLGGHSDIVGGAIMTNSDAWDEKLRFLIKSAGAAPGPMDCFLLLRGIKTLHLRMERHCENAAAVARFLRTHPKVEDVCWPGFENHPEHDLVKRQMRDFGGMVSFMLKDDAPETAYRVMAATKVFALAESLGGVESLISHPASMTHASIPAEKRRAAGLSDSLIRLSVGIEDEPDLIADLEQALEAA